MVLGRIPGAVWVEHMSKHSSRGTEWERVRQQVLARDGYLCTVPNCGATATHVDHIIPKSVGGTDSLDNLAAMCAPHNLKKGAKVFTRTTYLNPNYFKTSN